MWSSCTIYGEYGHYTHNYLELPKHRRLKQVAASSISNLPQGQDGTQPSNPPASKLIVLQNPFPPQGLVATHQEAPPSNQPSSSSPLGHPSFQNIDMNYADINLKTCNW